MIESCDLSLIKLLPEFHPFGDSDSSQREDEAEADPMTFAEFDRLPGMSRLVPVQTMLVAMVSYSKPNVMADLLTWLRESTGEQLLAMLHVDVGSISI
jgi:hypothetical protein